MLQIVGLPYFDTCPEPDKHEAERDAKPPNPAAGFPGGLEDRGPGLSSLRGASALGEFSCQMSHALKTQRMLTPFLFNPWLIGGVSPFSNWREHPLIMGRVYESWVNISWRVRDNSMGGDILIIHLIIIDVVLGRLSNTGF